MTKEIFCLLCFQKTAIDIYSKLQREKYRNIVVFRCCKAHLDAKIIGKSFNWTYSADCPTPFCESCFKSSENLWALEKQLRQAQKALKLYIGTFTNEIILARKTAPQKLIDSQYTNWENRTDNENTQFNIFNGVLAIAKDDDESVEYYQENLLGDTDVIDVKLKQEEDYFDDAETLETGVSSNLNDLSVNNDEQENSPSPASKYAYPNSEKLPESNCGGTDFAKNDIQHTFRELRICLERIKIDSSGKLLPPTRNAKRRKAATVACSSIRTNIGYSSSDDDNFYPSDSADYREEDMAVVSYSECNTNLTTRKTMRQRKPKVTKSFTCKHCKFVTKKRELYREHMRSHRDIDAEVPYSCYICVENFKNRTLLNLHNSALHKNDTFDCDICELTFKLYSRLQAHKVDVHGITSPYVCAFCPQKYKNSRTLRKHVRVSHPTKDVKKEEESVICDICGKNYSSRYRMQDHRRSVHFKNPNKPKRIRVYKHRPMNRKPDQTNRVRRPRQKGVKQPVGPGLYPCMSCEKKFAHYLSLDNHVKVYHTKEVSYECKLCGKQLANHQTLKNHMNDHSMAKTFPCEKCDRVFSQKYNLRSHMRRIHEMNKLPRKPFKRLAFIPLANTSESVIVNPPQPEQQAQGQRIATEQNTSPVVDVDTADNANKANNFNNPIIYSHNSQSISMGNNLGVQVQNTTFTF